MTFERIVMLDFEERDFSPEDWRELRGLATVLDRRRSSDPGLTAALAHADCLLVQLGVAVTPGLLEAAPQLRYIGVFGTSTGRIDVASRPGIVLRNVPGYSTEAVAEFAIGVMLDQLRDLSPARERAAAGDLSEPRREGRELRGRRLGILGLGSIGRRVAEIAGRGFGADVRAWSRTARPNAGIPHVEVDEILAGSEIISVHLALAPGTHRFLDAARIARIREGALLIHLAPPELLDLPSLARRLRDGSLRFVTDHADEMNPGDRKALSGIDACTLYPSIGYGTCEARTARRERFLGDLRSFLESARRRFRDRAAEPAERAAPESRRREQPVPREAESRGA